MPAQDSLWLHLDRPENLMVASVLWTRTPEFVAARRSGPLDPEKSTVDH